MTSSCKHSLSVTALLFQPRRCMATDGQQWEWAADQLRPPVATWRRVRGTRFGSCRAGSEAPSPSARRGSCSCWWRRRSAGWSGRVRCVSLWHPSLIAALVTEVLIQCVKKDNVWTECCQISSRKCERWCNTTHHITVTCIMSKHKENSLFNNYKHCGDNLWLLRSFSSEQPYSKSVFSFHSCPLRGWINLYEQHVSRLAGCHQCALLTAAGWRL